MKISSPPVGIIMKQVIFPEMRTTVSRHKGTSSNKLARDSQHYHADQYEPWGHLLLQVKKIWLMRFKQTTDWTY